MRKERTTISAAMCIIIGLVIGFMIKKVHIGLLIGLGLGLLGGGLLSKRGK
ncbi:MAG: hypothetical protein ACTHLD_04900 [Chitinophaga sp.]|jgi:hypothetical protein